MNLNLAAMYGTPGSEELQKVAEAELFAKLAAENNIDLNALSNDQIQELWSATFSKTAEEDEKEEAEKDDDKDEEEKKEAAAREHSVKLAQAEDEKRAHYLGQVMAHSYVAELSKIAAAREAGEGEAELEKDATKLLPAASGARSAFGRAATTLKQKARKAGLAVERGARKAGDFAKEHKGKAIAGGAALAAGGAGFAAGRAGKKKESSAIDELAQQRAVDLIQADGRFDTDEAALKVAAVAVLGLEESTKVASTADEQVEIRALEFLEAAGYPVEWS